ncbi:unnamed protein product [Orchesella dallaii]|uniref:K Homology domain-containing protein n=1 Tax=Orchesella dallaii TaxID=48710 RepID=A0ABP1RLE3_9HEXA
MRKGGGTGLYGNGPGGLPLHHPAHQRNGGGGGGGGGRIFVSTQGGGQMGPYNQHQHPHHHHAAAAAAALHQSGLALLHHPGAAGVHPHHGHNHSQQQQQHHHPHHNHRQFNGPSSSSLPQFQGGGGGSFGGGGGGPVASPPSGNSHFGQQSNNPSSIQASSLGGGGGSSSSSSSVVVNHAGTGGAGGGSGGGDMPPVETVVARLETACRLLHGIGGNNTRVNEISSEIQILSEDLRRVGSMLENTYPEVLDRVMSSMRDASAQPCLPPSLRLAIFELVELRASKWMLPSDSSNYYRQRRNLNDATDGGEERSGRNSSSGTSNINVVVTNCGSSGGSPIKPDPIFPPGTASSPPSSASVMSNMVAVETPAKTYREEIVIKNSDSGKVMGVRGRRVHLIEAISDTIISFEKVAPTAKERVLSINGYSQQSINLAKQLIQETITRNASPVLEGMVLPSSAASLSGDYPDLEDGDLVGMGGSLKRLQLQSSSSASQLGGISKLSSSDPHSHPHHHHHQTSSHFSYTVTLGDHSIKILGDDIQYVQEAKMALDDYFLQKYPDLFCAASIEDEEEEDEDDDQLLEGDENDPSSFIHQRYDRETLLSLSKVKTPSPDFSHLEPEVRGGFVLEKRREFDLEKFNGKGPTATTSLSGKGAASATSDILPG